MAFKDFDGYEAVLTQVGKLFDQSIHLHNLWRSINLLCTLPHHDNGSGIKCYRCLSIHAYIIWASPRENLSSGVCKQQMRRPAYG